ncbi:MAG: UvrD-helicase domain-containing protein, partial [Firmicutes bacterium]|nr:UvrD-helicase domain-containing protein [Bacillota bacterium]
MTSRWTGEQLAAITARDCNLLVSAAAGAGKTAVLVERIIRKITDVKEPLDIDKLLVVTFTKAAAAEMRERISTAIAHELNKNPESRHLNRQMTLLNRASITTIHSFCLDVLRQYFHCIDLDPVFRVADDTEAALLRMEALEETFEDYYANGPDEFFTLVDAYGGDRNDSYLQEMVLRLYQFAASTPWPSLWLRRLSEDYALKNGIMG